MTKEEAKRFGYSFFNTGKPCKNGHFSDRYLIGGAYVECCKTRPRNKPPMTRAKAKSLGLKKYWSKVPCKNGHTNRRFTATNVCCTCFKKYQSALYVLKHWPDSIDAPRARETVKNYEQI